MGAGASLKPGNSTNFLLAFVNIMTRIIHLHSLKKQFHLSSKG